VYSFLSCYVRCLVPVAVAAAKRGADRIRRPVSQVNPLDLFCPCVVYTNCTQLTLHSELLMLRCVVLECIFIYLFYEGLNGIALHVSSIKPAVLAAR
jgi:hypothetical protein